MDYKEQVERTRRWLNRLQNAASHENDINEPLPPGKHEEYEDYLYAFFQNCWHIKDWIMADIGAPGTLRDAVKRVEKEKPDALRLCADVANGSKHLGQPRDKNRAKTVGEIAVEIDPEGNSKTTYEYKVVDGETQHDALELARRALRTWDDLIAANNITPAAPESGTTAAFRQ